MPDGPVHAPAKRLALKVLATATPLRSRRVRDEAQRARRNDQIGALE